MSHIGHVGPFYQGMSFFDEDYEVDYEEKEVTDYLRLEELSFNGKIEGKRVEKDLSVKIYINDKDDKPLYHYFCNNIESFPSLNSKRIKNAAKELFEEYSFFNTEGYKILLNVEGNWEQISFNQFIKSLEAYLKDFYKDDIVENLVKEIKNVAISNKFE